MSYPFPQVTAPRSLRYRLTDFLDEDGMALLEAELADPRQQVVADWFDPAEPCAAWHIGHSTQRCLFQMAAQEAVKLVYADVKGEGCYVISAPDAHVSTCPAFVGRELFLEGLAVASGSGKPSQLPLELTLSIAAIVLGAYLRAYDDITVGSQFMMLRGLVVSSDRFPELFPVDSAAFKTATRRARRNVTDDQNRVRAKAAASIDAMKERFRRDLKLGS